MKTKCPNCKKEGKPANAFLGDEFSFNCQNKECPVSHFASGVKLSEEELKRFKRLSENYGSRKLKNLTK